MRKLLLLVLIGCAPSGPHWDYKCSRHHYNYIPMIHMQPAGKGVMVPITILTPVYHCDERESTWVVPPHDTYTNSRGQKIDIPYFPDSVYRK